MNAQLRLRLRARRKVQKQARARRQKVFQHPFQLARRNLARGELIVRLAADGAAVVVNYVRGEQAAQEVVAAIRKLGGQAVAIRADVSQPAEVRQLFAQARRRAGAQARSALGAPDIVVANAGVAVVKSIAESTEEEFDRVFDANAKGVFFTLQEATRQVRDGGRIVIVSTGGTRMLMTGRALSRQQRRSRAVRTSAVTRARPAQHHRQRTVAGIYGHRPAAGARSQDPRRHVALRSHRRAAEVASVAAFLASDDARWVTGQNVGAGGGVF